MYKIYQNKNEKLKLTIEMQRLICYKANEMLKNKGTKNEEKTGTTPSFEYIIFLYTDFCFHLIGNKIGINFEVKISMKKQIMQFNFIIEKNNEPTDGVDWIQIPETQLLKLGLHSAN